MSGILGGIFSAGNRMKRKLGGLLSNPLENIALGSTRMAEDMNALSALASEAGYMPNTVNRSDQSVLVTPQQKALARALLADKGADMGMAAATVWHGSPHKFDKFDSSKIGTGEGAQAYGHGLYLAESPEVAASYRDTLSRKSGPQNDIVQSYIQEAGGDRVKAAQALKDFVGYDTKGPFALKDRDRANVDEMLKQILDPPGSLYKVDLPDNAIAKMLDWDKPLSQQAPEVQKAVLSIDPGQQLSARGAAAYGDIRGLFDNAVNPPSVSMAEASKRLREAGIPGIRYLDGGSRGAGSGTSNYVIFPGNESLLQILERNGVPIK